MVKISFCFALLTSVAMTVTTRAATYYVNSVQGSDMNSGTAEASAWKTLRRINETGFMPGDRILFACGSEWHEQLAPRSSGKAGAPILFDWYGRGPLPRVAGDGVSEDAVLLRNVQQLEMRHIEITNQGSKAATRRGVQITLDNFGTAHHVVLSDLYIHDVNGNLQKKDNGGIVFRTNGDKIPSRFDGLSIERNIVWRVDRSGIVADSYHASRAHWFPSLHVVLRDNYVEDIGGDGIVPWATDGALVEHNIARKCNQRSTEYNAGIWQWSTDNTLLRLNEASETRGTHDGEGFDSDYNSRNTRFEYNYGHDNSGGFMLICTPVKRDPGFNLGNTGTIVRLNISRNDHTRLINLSGADDVRVEQNAFYVGAGDDVQMLTSDWQGWSQNAIFQKNVFSATGTLRFGHAVARNANGTYLLSPGWGPAKNIVYTGNTYIGHILDPPVDRTGLHADGEQPREAAMNWAEPTFDVTRPETFAKFIAAHRVWMKALFQQQFGHLPEDDPAPRIDTAGSGQRTEP